MRRLLPVLTALSLFASACIAGGENVLSTGTDPPPSTVSAPAETSTSAPVGTTENVAPTSTSVPATTTTTTAPDRPTGVVTSATVGRPWGDITGVTMFRGNPTRTYYGEGPVPAAPRVLWRFPDEPMCGQSPVGQENKVWCGTGWTGQPLVWERPDGVTEVIFGAFDKKIHFLDAVSGGRTRPDFDMGDIVKGTLTLDPDGYPILYAGSRDPRFRIVAIDGEEPHELWSLHAKSVEGIWNDDWDANGVVVDDMLYIGGENSWWFAIKLNRGYDDEGMVTVDPEVVFQMPAWSEELRTLIGRQQSVENSTAVFGQHAFFANSAGRVVGLDVSDIQEGEADVFFDFWMGDDTDATITIDEEGLLYVAAQTDLSLRITEAAARVEEVGQVVKLDPTEPNDPILWSVDIPPARGQRAGVWATPALVDDILFVPGNPGDLLAIDTANGEVVWSDFVGGNAWSSPIHADGTLILAVNCLTTSPGLRAYDVTDPRSPVPLWERSVSGSCIEATPTVWKGRIFVGSRDGYFYALGDA